MKRNVFRKFKKINFRVQPKLFIVLGSAVLMCFALAYVGGLVYSSRLFIVRDIRCNAVIDAGLQRMIKKVSLIKLDTQKLHRYIMKHHPEYKAVTITKEFPSSLGIEIKKRLPCAQIKAQKFYAIDRESVVIDDGSNAQIAGLIPIEIADLRTMLLRGTKINDSRLDFALQVMSELRKKKFLAAFPVVSINATTPANFYIILANTNIVLGSDDIKYKLLVLEGLIKTQLKGKLNQVEYIDLRYKKAYIGFKR